MNLVKCVLLLSLLNITPAQALEETRKPIYYTFIFKGGDTLRLDDRFPSLVKGVAESIIRTERQLLRAELTFPYGEILTVEFNGARYTGITLAGKGEKTAIPDNILHTVPYIDFSNIALVSEDSSATTVFECGLFYIQYKKGDHYGFLRDERTRLVFKDQKFTEITTWYPNGRPKAPGTPGRYGSQGDPDGRPGKDNPGPGDGPRKK